MIYQCSGCNQDKDDDTDIGTLVGEDYYCEGCLANRNGILDGAIEAIRDSFMPNKYESEAKQSLDLRITNKAVRAIEQLKGE